MPEYIAEFVPSDEGLDAFTIDYLEAIEWLLDEEERPNAIGFASETIAKAKEDCAEFQEVNYEDLSEYCDLTGHTGGVDLWLTRNRHGAGFWDRGLGDLGKRLTDAARLGECNSYVGDNGLIYLV
jgi:hypothetical protein